MRFLAAFLLLAVGAAVIVTTVAPEWTFAGAGPDWLPAEVGRGAELVDGLFHMINGIAAALLGLTFVLMAWAVWRGAGRRSDEGSDRAGSHSLEIAWTAVPAVILGFLTWAQIDARADIRDAVADRAGEPAALIVEVEGAQFDWRFRYAGEDGAFGTLDDVTTVAEMAVPIGRNVELQMRSVDVIHSFFVPALRIKRDVVPGATVPLRFQIDPADYEAAGRPRVLELRCAELCGWGHYAMVGRLRPMDGDAFDAWLAQESAARFSPGNAKDAEDESEDE